MFLGPLLMIFWLVVLVAAIVLVLRWLGAMPGGSTPQRSARDVLDERYARGEIDHDEYEKRRTAMNR
jgi:putative membrane protein